MPDTPIEDASGEDTAPSAHTTPSTPLLPADQLVVEPAIPHDEGVSPRDNLQGAADDAEFAITHSDNEHDNHLDKDRSNDSPHTDTESSGTRDDNLTHLLFRSDDETSGSDFGTTQAQKRRSKLKKGLPNTSDEDEDEEELFEAEIELSTRQTFRGRTVVSEGDKNSDDEQSYAKKSGPLPAEVKAQATALHDAYMEDMKQLARENGVSVQVLHKHISDVTVKHHDISTWNAFQAYQAAHGNGCPEKGISLFFRSCVHYLIYLRFSRKMEGDDAGALPGCSVNIR